MAEVIKRDGNKEAFEPNDIKSALTKAFEEGGLSPEENKEKIDDLIKEVTEVAEEKGEMHTERIREMILSKLDDIAPEASEAWRKHDREHKSRE
jgi:transcriptional regulator NrdR family protein